MTGFSLVFYYVNVLGEGDWSWSYVPLSASDLLCTIPRDMQLLAFLPGRRYKYL
jgi:hypothetical protein